MYSVIRFFFNKILVEIPVLYPDAVLRMLTEPVEYSVSKRNRSMSAARTAYGYDKLILALGHIVRNQKGEHILELVKKCGALAALPDKQEFRT